MAAGIALVSSIGNLVGGIGPSVTSAINTASGGTVHSLYFVMSLYVLAALIVLAVARPAAKALQARAA